MSIRILVCDDQELARSGIRFALEGVADIQIVGESDSGQSAQDLAQYLHPDVVLMDVVMPDDNGINITRKLRACVPHPKVLAVSMHADTAYVQAMMAAGASGYVDKSCAYEELAVAIHQVITGRTYLSPSLSKDSPPSQPMGRRQGSGTAGPGEDSALTGRNQAEQPVPQP